MSSIMDLGPNNEGGIGPDKLGIDESQMPSLAEQALSLKYRRKASDTYHCIDGRNMKLTEELRQLLEVLKENDEGLTQVAGSKPLQDVSIKLMRQEMLRDGHSGSRLSELIIEKTRESVSNGYPIFVHGDEAHGKAGCGANVNQRVALQRNMHNIEIVAPAVFEMGKKFGFSKHVDIEAIRDLVVTGFKNAENEGFWDVTPEQKIDIMIENGASYVELIGPHLEAAAVVVTDEEETVDGNAFRRDHPLKDGLEVQLFIATHAKALADIRKDGLARGDTESEVALDQAAATLWLIGVSKKLTNEHLKVFLPESQKVAK